MPTPNVVEACRSGIALPVVGSPEEVSLALEGRGGSEKSTEGGRERGRAEEERGRAESGAGVSFEAVCLSLPNADGNGAMQRRKRRSVILGHTSQELIRASHTNSCCKTVAAREQGEAFVRKLAIKK